MTSTYFGLLAEFGESEIPLAKVAPKFLGMSLDKAAREASMNRLPFPAYRAGSQKSPWLVSAGELAKYLDEQKAAAAESWQRSQAGPAPARA